MTLHPGDTVLAPVPQLRTSMGFASRAYIVRDEDGWPTESLRRCTVESGPHKDGRYLLTVKWSHTAGGIPHRVFARPDECRVAPESAPTTYTLACAGGTGGEP